MPYSENNRRKLKKDFLYLKIMKRTNRILIIIFCVGIFAAQIFAQKTASDPRVANALKQAETGYELDKEGLYKVSFGVGEKRNQTAFVASATDTLYGFEMRNVFSFAVFSKTPFSADVMSRLLDENMNHVSTWAIIKIDKDTYAIVNSIFIPADADAKRLDAAIQSVVVAADDLEAKMSKEDKL